MDIIVATNNQGKVKEIKNILAPHNVMSQSEIGIDIDVEETGDTFLENAFLKARALKQYTDCAIIADDSGLMVDYLNGEPGIYSARYHGLNGDDERNELLIHLLEGVENRRAHFHCSIVLYINKDRYYEFAGEVYGNVSHKIEGTNGFGYDSLFIPNGYDKTFGLLDIEIKNRISHRAIAINKLAEFFENDFNN